MEAFFGDIVATLNAICKRTGLSYAAINILIYTILAPSTWALVLSLRQRKYTWLLIIHSVCGAWFILNHQKIQTYSQRFYDANIIALEQMGYQYPNLGYIGVSIIAGVVMPIILLILLFLIPIRYALKTYILLILLNISYYVWVLFK